MGNDQRLRSVDLARLAGVSTQQIRNYEEAGVLPPAARTDSGYRTFRDVHRRALLTYRTLVKGYGPVTAARIMQALHAGDAPGALALVDEVHAALHEERGSLRAASEALRALARQQPAPLPGSGGLRIGEVAALLGVRTSALRVWEAAGLLTPGRERGTKYRVYGPADVRDARLIHTLRRSHYLLDQIRPVLEGLRREGDTEALRAAIAARGEALTARTRAMLEGSGRLYDYLGHLAGLDHVTAGGTTTGSTADAPAPSAT
jgi:DNA-binding transcriptional MerR regulator